MRKLLNTLHVMTQGAYLHRDGETIAIKVGHIGKTSFSFEYTLKRGKTLVGTAKTVHVTIDQKSRKKIDLPPALRCALTKYQSTAK